MVQTKVENSAIQLSRAANIRRVWGDLIFNVKETSYGAKGDGATTDTVAIVKAITDAAVDGGTVVFPPSSGDYVTSDFTVPSNVTLWFMNGAKLSINSGATVTINGPIDAGLYQIFSGPGSISGKIKVEYFYPQWWGAVGDGVSDDTASLTKVLQAAYSAGGGVVYAPQGIYLLKTQIIIPKGVKLMGMGSKAAPQWVDGIGWDKSNYGTVFAIDWGAGGTDINNSAFLMSSYSKTIGCSFWYPNQSGSTLAPLQYPPTIAHVNGDANESNNSVVQTDIKNCVFVNPWIAMKFTRSHELLNINDVQYYAWNRGIVIDESSDIDRLSDIHANPNTMYRGFWPANNAYEYSLSNFGVGLEIGRADQIMIDRCFIFGFDRSCWIHKINTNNPGGVVMEQCGFEYGNCALAIHDAVRRMKLLDVMLGTRDHASAGRALEISLPADTITDEIDIDNLSVFMSSREAVFFGNVQQFTMDNSKIYNACTQNPGFETAGLQISGCKGFAINNCHVEINGVINNAAIEAKIENSNGFAVTNLFLSGQTKASPDVFIGTSTHGRLVRTFITNSSGLGVVQAASTDVTSVDVITY